MLQIVCLLNQHYKRQARSTEWSIGLSFYGIRFFIIVSATSQILISSIAQVNVNSHEIPWGDTWELLEPHQNFWWYKWNWVSYYRLQFVPAPIEAEELKDYQRTLGNTCARVHLVRPLPLCVRIGWLCHKSEVHFLQLWSWKNNSI